MAELVEYTKKLIMTGVLMKASQGSASQVFIGLIISFLYFAIVVRYLPYNSMRTNVIRVSGELQLFLTMVCMLMLRLDLHQEWITNVKVGWILIAVNFIMTPIPFVYDLLVRVKMLTRELKVLQQTHDNNKDGGGCLSSLKLLIGPVGDFVSSLDEMDEVEFENPVAEE